ncbi:COA1 [Bugula neritina]|uniref:COA1 n=1 Tax=Bugula neritina TaxID=10212 RepID=A0A7J7J153_BUGNE|nr:COA1 [Bugula neritina]
MYQSFKKLIAANAVWKFCAAGALVPLSAALYNEKVQVDLKKQPYYMDSMKLISGYPVLEEYLGKSYSIKRISRGASSNTRIGKEFASLDIPVQGPKDRGVIHIQASHHLNGWVVDQMDIKLRNAQKEWTFYRNQKLGDE